MVIMMKLNMVINSLCMCVYNGQFMAINDRWWWWWWWWNSYECCMRLRHLLQRKSLSGKPTSPHMQHTVWRSTIVNNLEFLLKLRDKMKWKMKRNPIRETATRESFDIYRNINMCIKKESNFFFFFGSRCINPITFFFLYM